MQNQQSHSGILSKIVVILTQTKARLLAPECLVPSAIAIFVCALIGPFGTYAADPFWVRLLFWGGTVIASVVLALTFSSFSEICFAHRTQLFRDLLGSSLFIVFFTPLNYQVIKHLYPPGVIPSFTIILGSVIGVTMSVYFIMRLVTNSKKQHNLAEAKAPVPIEELTEESHADAPEPQVAPHFLTRLGPDAGDRLIRLAMSDHYIEAVTETGKHLLYMRFSDALEELSGDNGGQVHRSHWVNFSEIKDVVKNRQSVSITMSDGASVPVSRSRKKQLQESGII